MKNNKSSSDSSLGNIDKNVFIAGNKYFGSLIRQIENAVRDSGLNPRQVEDFGIPNGTERHSAQLALQNCKYAIFETSDPDFEINLLDEVQSLSINCLCLWDNTNRTEPPEIDHPVFINKNKPYDGKDSLEKEVYEFLGYKPDAQESEIAARLYIDDIDSFEKIKQINPANISDLVPLTIPEQVIKGNLAEIINEPFVDNDWGGEYCDLISSHVVYQGKRLSAGFVLKGPGLRRKSLKISGLGKNGDQIVRMIMTTQDVYIVQFVGHIDQSVIETLRAHVTAKAYERRKILYYCLINGTDTARLFKAYGKI